MKRLAMVLLVATATAMAQQSPAPMAQDAMNPNASQEQQNAPVAPKLPKFQSNWVQKPQAPTYSDINCSGFITRENISLKNQVVGGETSPHTSQFGGRDLIFLSGEGYTVGAQYRIVRRVSDKNRVEAFPGQYKLGKDA